MKKFTPLFCSILLFIGFTAVCSSQDSLKLKPIGIGVRFVPFNLLESETFEVYSLPRVTLTINLSNRFRFEPELAVSYESEKSEIQSYSYLFALGSYYQFQRGKLNFYTGLNAGLMKYIVPRETIVDGDKVEYNDISQNIWFGPTFGFEYFLHPHFSLGGELLIKNTSHKSYSNPSLNSYEEFESAVFSTSNSLFIRGYF